MKELEKKFFKYCCKNIDYNLDILSSCKIIMFRKDIIFKDLIDTFSAKYNCSKKQLYYYLEKWERIGMVDYGVSLKTGWFVFKDIKDSYLSIIPKRVMVKYISKIDLDMYKKYLKLRGI